MRAFVRHFDKVMIHGLKKISLPLARGALFIVFFWFGLLKLLGLSAANVLVAAQLHMTMPFWSFESFVVFLGLFEMFLGLCFVLPHLERLAIALLIAHMITTFLPLVLLPELSWQRAFVPTLEGQYIIKNLVIIALAFSIASHLHPMRRQWPGAKILTKLLRGRR